MVRKVNGIYSVLTSVFPPHRGIIFWGEMNCLQRSPDAAVERDWRGALVPLWDTEHLLHELVETGSTSLAI